jgi:hypothetical protein
MQPIPSDFLTYERILFSLTVYRWSKWFKIVKLFKLRLIDNVIVVKLIVEFIFF